MLQRIPVFRMKRQQVAVLDRSGYIAKEAWNGRSAKFTARSGARKIWLAVALIVLIPIVVWQRGVWADAYARSQIKHELEKKGADYRKVAVLGLRRAKVRIAYPYYWDKTESDGRLELSFPRYTGSINEMVFEALPGSSGGSQHLQREASKAIPRPNMASFKRDTTLGGEEMNIYRYGKGKSENDGYREYIVAVYPKRALRVTLVQWYRRGPYVEDDIAMNRMLNVLYGLKFD